MSSMPKLLHQQTFFRKYVLKPRIQEFYRVCPYRLTGIFLSKKREALMGQAEKFWDNLWMFSQESSGEIDSCSY